MQKLLDILSEIRPEFDFSTSNDLFEEGVFDSFDLITLVSEIDAAYGISIDGTEIVPENFGSVEKIKTLIQRHKATL